MRYKEEINNFSPKSYNILYNIIKNSIDLVTKYVLQAGTYYYFEEVLDYTESTSLVMYGFFMLDKEFKTNHQVQINAAINTILERQSEDGAYYITNSTLVEIFYTDNIAQYTWHFIESVSQSVENTKKSILLYSILFIISIISSSTIFLNLLPKFHKKPINQ